MKKIGEMNRKELLTELGRWMKRAEDQHKENVKLREQLKVYESGSNQMNRVVDAILIEVTKKFGMEKGEGVFEVVINQPVVKEKPEEILFAAKNELDHTYTMRVEPAKKRISN